MPEPSFVDTNAVKSENEKLTQENTELEQEVENLQKARDTLLQRPSLHKERLANHRETYYRKITSELRHKRNQLEDNLDTASCKMLKLTTKIKALGKDVTKSELESATITKEYEETEEQLLDRIAQLEERIQELEDDNADIMTQLQKEKAGHVNHVNAAGKMTYTGETCENVGPVIEAVLAMVGKAANQLPSGRTCSNMGREILAFSQHQHTELKQEENLTLATDETPKCGDYYMAYTLNDDDDSYASGMRDIVSNCKVSGGHSYDFESHSG